MRIGQILDGFMIIVSIAHCDALLSRPLDFSRHQQQWLTQKTNTPCDRHILREVDIVDSFYYLNPPPNHIVCII